MSLIDFERRFFAGIDIGQVNDWTAISVIERVRAVPRIGIHHALVGQAKYEASNTPVRLDLAHLERISLGTLYPRQVEIIASLLHQPILSGVQSYIDATGVGRPIHQALRAAKVRDLYGITITGSRGEAKRTSEGWNVGKSELVNGIQIEMQNGRLGIAEGLELFSTLERELMDFRASINTHGNMTFNAREGQNDDLVLAVGYAVFGATRPIPVHHIDMRFVA